MFRQDCTGPALLLVAPGSWFRLQSITFFLAENFPACSTTTHPIFDNWAVPLSLATTKGISVDFFSPVTVMFSIHRVRFRTPIYQCRYRLLRGVSPIRKLPVKAFCQPRPTLISGSTSFIAFYRQGNIHHVLLLFRLTI